MARYWRMTSILTWSGTLELSEAQLYEGGTPVAVTPTASVAPTSGSLGDLVDALATASVVWSGAMPTLVWDTAGLTDPDLRLGAGTSEDAYPVDLILQSSDDAIYWTTHRSLKSLAYPGDWTLTADPGSGLTDPYFSNVSLLLRADGTHGSTAITDSSPAAHTVTPYGNTSISTANSHSGGSSLYFDGSGDYATIPTSTDFDFGGGDVTIEFWFRTTQTTAYATLLGREWQGAPYTGAWTIFLNDPSGRLQVYFTGYNTNGPFMTGTTTSHKDGNWHHLAWVKNGDDHKLFLDGVVEATATSAATFAAGGRPLTIGNDITYGPRNFAGYIDDLRITKGVARYTTAFTPPATYVGDGSSLTTGPRKYKASALASPVYTNPAPGFPTEITVTQHLPAVKFSDPIYGGKHQIVGTVKEKSTPTNKPLPRRVVLIDERAQLAVRETWSDAAGNYQFYGIRGDLRYTVISYDYSGTYRAVIADNVTPEPIV
jgi:hypothetical protein